MASQADLSAETSVKAEAKRRLVQATTSDVPPVCDHPRHEMVIKVAKAMSQQDLSTEDSWPFYAKMARAAIEAMRAVPDLCYERYRCDKMWRDLDSKEVWNLWIDAALRPSHDDWVID